MSLSVLRWLRTRLRRRAESEPDQFRYSPRVGWWADRRWMDEYADALAGDRIPEAGLTETRILDRRFMLKECAEATRKLTGSTAECGVYTGVGSAIICTALRDSYHPGELHFGFDSFAGLPPPTDADRDAAGVTHWRASQLTTPLQVAEAALGRFPFCRLVPGWMPDSFAPADRHRFRFVHIDVDLHQPTLDALRFFYPRMTRGGVILCDDYGMTSCPGAKKAMDDFFADKPESVIELTAGSGMVAVSGRPAEGPAE